MSERRYLVTGASGFVGGHLARALFRKGHPVATILRDGDVMEGIEVFRGSVEDRDVVRRALSKFKPDGVFHLAAQAKVEPANLDPMGTWESNIRGTYTLLNEVMSGQQCPVVVASSDHAYGMDHDNLHPIDENEPVGAGGIYDTSKACTDLIAQTYGRLGLSVSIVRCGNIYGPCDRDMTRIVPSLISDIMNGRAPTLRSDGTPVRDYLFVSDAINGYAAVMGDAHLRSDRRASIFNLSAGNPLSAHDVAQKLIKTWLTYTGYVYNSIQPIAILGTRTGEINHLSLDSSLARKTLAWYPDTNIEKGLTETICWWRGTPTSLPMNPYATLWQPLVGL